MKDKKKLNLFMKLYYLLLTPKALANKVDTLIKKSKDIGYIMQIVALRKSLLMTPNLLYKSINYHIDGELLAIYLINEGITLTDKCRDLSYLMDNIIFSKFQLLAKYIIKKENIDVNLKNTYGSYLIHTSIGYKCNRLTTYLISKGANINVLNPITNNTLLMKAIQMKNTYIAKYLIDMKCDLSNTNISGKNAFWISIDYRCLEIAKYLLDTKMNLNLNSSDISNNDFSKALSYGNIEIIDKIIDTPMYKEKIKEDIKCYIEFICYKNNLELGYYLFEKLVNEDSITIDLDTSNYGICQMKDVLSISFIKNGIIQIKIK